MSCPQHQSRPLHQQRRNDAPPWQRCDKKWCQWTRGEMTGLRATVASLESELRALKKALELGGEARGWNAKLVEAQTKLLKEQEEHRTTMKQRSFYAKQVQEAEAERQELARERSSLKAEVSLLRRQVAQLERDALQQEIAERYSQRASARELRAVEGLLAAAETRASDAEASQEVAEAAAESRERELEVRSSEAAREAAAAVQELMMEQEAVREAKKSLNNAESIAWNAERRAERAKDKAEKLQARLNVFAPPTTDRSIDEWTKLSDAARWKAAQREREFLISIFSEHTWRMQDVADALHAMGWVEKLFETRPIFEVFYTKVEDLMKHLELNEYGEMFGLYLHYELHLTLPKILSITQSASKVYDRVSDRFQSKVLLHHKFQKHKVIKVPRVAPPTSKLQPRIRQIESLLGVEPAEDGRLAFKSITQVVQELLMHDPGRYNMPPLPFFAGGANKLPIVISLDATGYGNQQLCTIVLRNPYMSASAQQLHTFGVGNCSDDRDGATRLLGPNLAVINKMIALGKALGCMEVDVSGELCKITPDVLICQDVSALRHGEHIANAGWCGCSRDFALRAAPPKKPTTAPRSCEHSCTCATLTPALSDTCYRTRHFLARIFPGPALPRGASSPITGRLRHRS